MRRAENIEVRIAPVARDVRVVRRQRSPGFVPSLPGPARWLAWGRALADRGRLEGPAAASATELYWQRTPAPLRPVSEHRERPIAPRSSPSPRPLVLLLRQRCFEERLSTHVRPEVERVVSDTPVPVPRAEALRRVVPRSPVPQFPMRFAPATPAAGERTTPIQPPAAAPSLEERPVRSVATAWTPPDVRRLADAVLDEIDGRILAERERLGG